MIRKSLSEPDFFWKNFRLGTELQISGSFIYNALYFFDKLEYIHYEEDIFEFLYDLSVGIERLQKITIILLEHDEKIDQTEFEKSLITHDHTALLGRIRKIHEVNLGKVHSKFLNLLRDFYTSYRYERFNKNSVHKPDFDKKKFQEFLVKELNLEISKKDEAWYPYKKEEWIENTLRVKRFIGKLTEKIVVQLYDIIRNRAYELGTYTYEIRYKSKAFKIFMMKDFNFETENNLKKEIMITLLNKKAMNDDFKKYIQELEPLPLEERNSSYYIKYLFNSIGYSGLLSDYRYMIEEKEIPKGRAEEIEPIGEEQFLFSDFDEDEDFND